MVIVIQTNFCRSFSTWCIDGKNNYNCVFRNFVALRGEDGELFYEQPFDCDFLCGNTELRRALVKRYRYHRCIESYGETVIWTVS